jgi:hypothetical protein
MGRPPERPIVRAIDPHGIVFPDHYKPARAWALDM